MKSYRLNHTDLQHCLFGQYTNLRTTQKNEKPMQTPQTPLALLALFNGTAVSAYSKALEAFDIVLVK